MRIVLQRVSKASVSVDDEQKCAIGKGLMLLVGIHQEDTEEQMQWLADKILKLRVFDDADGKMNLSVEDVEGEILLVPQFTLYGEIDSGTRPGYSSAARPGKASKLFDKMIEYVKEKTELSVKTGVFGAYMDVQLNNDGPVTLILEK